MLNSNNIYKVGIFEVGKLRVTYVLFCILINSSISYSQTQIFSPQEQELNESYALADLETIRAFVREVIDEPLSSSYVIPTYIKESKDAEEASKIVGAFYPEFYGKQGILLLDAVKAHPAIYVRMIKEYKAIRMLFEPTN